MPGIWKRRKDMISDDIVEVKQDELMKNRSKEDHAKLTRIPFGPLTREASPQTDDQVPNEGTMHLGVHDVSRTIYGKTASQFRTSLFSTLTIPRQTYYHVLNGCAIQMGIDDVSRTINAQSDFGFHTNLRSIFTIPRGVVHATYNASRTMNGKTCSGFHTNAQPSTLTSPRETSTQEDYHVSNGGPMHFSVDDVSRTINRQTGTAFHTYSRSTVAIPRYPRRSTMVEQLLRVLEEPLSNRCFIMSSSTSKQGIYDVSRIINEQTGSEVHINSHITLVIPRETNTQADDRGVMHLAIDNVFKTINEITGSVVHTNPLSKFTNPSTQADDSISNRGAAQLDINDAYRATNAKTGIEYDNQTSVTPQLARTIFNVWIKGEYAQSNGVVDNEPPMMLTYISLAGLFGIYAVVCCIS
ncbi:hypothetical protein GIB67_016675 [Kingdonia uniflora]|uniref:Uncharacterized protein n=1 Tax=Kingdonia uniflora TaxID=39325 RepID=A0A7J7ME76_9MAGN|nr:hypothetical protein GIB67_016675 [Kingdonia uniflora]